MSACRSFDCILFTLNKLRITSNYVLLFSADDQLEDSTKESLEESKGETEVSSSLEGGNDSIAESTEQGGVDNKMMSEVDGESPVENTSHNGAGGKEETAKDDTTSEVTAEHTPAVGDEDSVKVLSLQERKEIVIAFVVLQCNN